MKTIAVLFFSYVLLVFGYTMGIHYADASNKAAAKFEATQVKAVTTVMACSHPVAVVISKGDGSQVVLSPVVPSIVNALYERVGEGFAVTVEVPCGVIT